MNVALSGVMPLAASSGSTNARAPLPGRPTVIRLPVNSLMRVYAALPR